MEENRSKALDEKFCESCGEAIKLAAVICPKCGVKQKTSGIMGFFQKQTDAFKAKIAATRAVIDEEISSDVEIDMPRKVIGIIIACVAGWTGVTGLGSLVAGRPRAGMALLGIPLFLGVLLLGCIFATFVSLILCLFVIGVPFFFFFGTLTTILFPLFITTFIGFWYADVMICIKAKTKSETSETTPGKDNAK